MRVLVCGNRDWSDMATIRAWLEWLSSEANARVIIPKLIHGGQQGADRFADHIARGLGWDVLEFKPDWRHGPKAGPERNARMMAARPSMALAFGVLRRVRDQREDEIGMYDMLCKLSDGGVLTYVIGKPGILP